MGYSAPKVNRAPVAEPPRAAGTTPAAPSSAHGSETNENKATIACLVCRSRKVRCDKTIPECKNCLRLGVPCPGFSLDTESISRTEIQRSAEDIFKAAGVEKRRVGSCEECRSSKHRCTRVRPTCRRCYVKKLRCVYPERIQRQSASTTSEVPHGDLSATQEPSPTSSVTRAQSHLRNVLDGSSPDGSLDFSPDNEQLFSTALPTKPALRLLLVNAFFNRSYGLRCLNFIHKRSFLASIDRESVFQDYGEPVLQAICALGAMHLYHDYLSLEDGNASHWRAVPGQQWAERARKEVLAEIDSPTVHHLMAMVLLCDYGLRSDQNSMVFILVGFLYRVIRLLGLDSPSRLEHHAPPEEILQRETQHRLVWACYFIDLFMATGVERNASWKDGVPEIPLPCLEQHFQGQIYSTQYFVPEMDKTSVIPAIGELDLSSLEILVVRLRIQGLRLIRTKPRDLETEIWDPLSPFLQILQRLEEIYQHLPEQFQLNDSNILFLKERRMLGSVFFLHFLIHAVVFDLARISLPGFNFPLSVSFQSSPPEFSSHIQQRCEFHAAEASNLVRKGLMYGREAFDDIFTNDAALEAAKIQIIYAATVDQSTEVNIRTQQNVAMTLEFFSLFTRGRHGPNQYIRTLLPLCLIFGFGDIAEQYKDLENTDTDPAEVTGSAEVEHLSQFAPFRRAQAELKTRSTSSPRTVSSQNTQTSPATQGSRRTSTAPIPLPLEGGPTLHDLNLDYNFDPSLAPPGFTNSTDQFFGQVDGLDLQGQPLDQPGVDDFIWRAGELSGYLTWQTMDLPPWFYENSFYPHG